VWRVNRRSTLLHKAPKERETQVIFLLGRSQAKKVDNQSRAGEARQYFDEKYSEIIFVIGSNLDLRYGWAANTILPKNCVREFRAFFRRESLFKGTKGGN
jgi:hypothetical protein